MRFTADDLAAAQDLEWDCDDSMYHAGCGQDDTTDSRGEKLRPYYNEGGEPYWM